jgi:hypothetical protein
MSYKLLVPNLNQIIPSLAKYCSGEKLHSNKDCEMLNAMLIIMINGKSTFLEHSESKTSTSFLDNPSRRKFIHTHVNNLMSGKEHELIINDTIDRLDKIGELFWQ